MKPGWPWGLTWYRHKSGLGIRVDIRLTGEVRFQEQVSNKKRVWAKPGWLWGLTWWRYKSGLWICVCIRLTGEGRFREQVSEKRVWMKPERLGFENTFPTPKSKKITQLKRKSELKVCAYTGLTRKKASIAICDRCLFLINYYYLAQLPFRKTGTMLPSGLIPSMCIWSEPTMKSTWVWLIFMPWRCNSSGVIELPFSMVNG